jgi:ATP-dependent Clp protease ATP-binding subunit ClpA
MKLPTRGVYLSKPGLRRALVSNSLLTPRPSTSNASGSLITKSASRSLPPILARYNTGSIQRRFASTGGPNKGFPGFSMGPQHQKGEALKEYVGGTLYITHLRRADKQNQSVDLTELARSGKLDPVIGRDEGASY